MFSLSFILPAYNEELLIENCIQSIKNAINFYNEIINSEIIVVDNCSTDSTAEIAKKLGCKVVTCDKKGITWARQAGSDAASYEYQVFIDSDNIIPEDFIKNIKYLDDPDTVAISGRVCYKDSNLLTRACTSIFFRLAMLAHKTIGVTLQGGCFALKRSKLVQAGGFPTEVPFFGEDSKSGQILSKVGKIKLIPSMWVYTSNRRLEAEGTLKTAYTYTINYFSICFTGNPYTLLYNDIRPKKSTDQDTSKND